MYVASWGCKSFCVVPCVSFCTGHFCHGALKHDISTLFYTILCLIISSIYIIFVCTTPRLTRSIVSTTSRLIITCTTTLLTRNIVCTTPRHACSLHVRYLDLLVLLHVRSSIKYCIYDFSTYMFTCMHDSLTYM